MKIVHYLRAVQEEEGGVVRAVLDLTGALAARGHAVTLCSRRLPETASTHPNAAAQPKLVAVKGALGPWLTPSGLACLAPCLADADVVHLHQLFDPSCAQVAKLAERMHVPYVVTLHGVLDDWSMAQKSLKKRAYLSLVGRRVLRAAAKVHCTAGAEQEQSARWRPRGEVAVMPYVTDLTPFRDLPGPKLARKLFPQVFSANRPVVLFLSRIHPKKGLERLLQAAAILYRQDVSVEVAIAGTGAEIYERQLRQLAVQLGIGQRVHFLGFVRGQEKHSLYQAADIFALPTSQENWGLVLTESLACGTPVVTTRGTDIWQELHESGGAEITDMTAEATAGALARLLSNPQQRMLMGQRGRNWLFAHLDMDRVVGGYERLYTELSSPRAAMRAAA